MPLSGEYEPSPIVVRDRGRASSSHRIDVHQHVVPAFWAKELPTHGGDPSGTVIPQWSHESAIDFMDSLEIATGVVEH
jgi:6-methylsalicylate decarboxylase